MEIVVHSKKSSFQQVSKENVQFQQELKTYVCDVKNDPIGLRESDKKIRLRLLVLLRIRIRLRLHPKTSDSLRLRNPVMVTANKI